MKNILVILGPTATGKSKLAVRIANKYEGEVISADSRQVYTGLDIGTGKITKSEMRGIPHHMLDVVSPKKVFSVADWKKQAEKIIAQIISRGKLPIICGGTGFYIQSIVDNIVLPEVPPNFKLRKKLQNKTATELFKILQKLDPERAKTIEPKNPVRLIRAIEIAKTLGKVPPMSRTVLDIKNDFEFLQIGLKLPDHELKRKIRIRLFARIREGMVEEAKKLHRHGLSWKRMRELGLEYRYLSYLIQKKITKEEFVQKLQTEIWRYAKRQMTWFKRDKRIKWFSPKETAKIDKEVAKFLKIW